jgi:hypothetical protein
MSCGEVGADASVGLVFDADIDQATVTAAATATIATRRMRGRICHLLVDDELRPVLADCSLTQRDAPHIAMRFRPVQCAVMTHENWRAHGACATLGWVSKNRGDAIFGLALATLLRRGVLYAIVALWFVIMAGEALIAFAIVVTGVYFLIYRDPLSDQVPAYQRHPNDHADAELTSGTLCSSSSRHRGSQTQFAPGS